MEFEFTDGERELLADAAGELATRYRCLGSGYVRDMKRLAAEHRIDGFVVPEHPRQASWAAAAEALDGLELRLRLPGPINLSDGDRELLAEGCDRLGRHFRWSLSRQMYPLDAQRDGNRRSDGYAGLRLRLRERAPA